jgi:hypothetical protein
MKIPNYPPGPGGGYTRGYTEAGGRRMEELTRYSDREGERERAS